ncbi:hypothetical protein J5218_000749 [Escherichia coli]|nr:hypothetical protein [Escherichia coli]EFO0570683.1 hypothetical protein [Escherichia coli]EHH7055792.1 hypothetical protein [Escherichia coli]ELW6151748.1 hypothetical protein [Escherichia coli]EMD6777603.1 hypothetical protein [Escherichia coli]
MNTNEVSVINLDQLVSMSSYDFLTKVINPARVEAGEKPVRNNDFVSRIEGELDGQNVAYEIFVSFGQDVKSYTLNTDQLLLVGMRESKAVRRKVLAYIRQKEQEVLELQAQQLQVAQTKAICYAPGAIVLDSKLDSKSGATPTEVIKALDLKLTSSKMLTASVLTGYLKTLCRPNPFYTKRVTEFGTTDIDLSTGCPRAVFNKKGETNGYYRLQPQPNDKEPTIKILRKGYDWLKDNWKDIAHDMRTSNIKVVRRLVDSHLNGKATKSQKAAAGKGSDYGF